MKLHTYLAQGDDAGQHFALDRLELSSLNPADVSDYADILISIFHQGKLHLIKVAEMDLKESVEKEIDWRSFKLLKLMRRSYQGENISVELAELAQVPFD